ncbi:flagellar biosynthetic protein FliR [Ramlibacter tataouinensis]|uniref:flagellar biosynthetic protein FliR n=1 Tax=Ramlibacter tataouinensis TaxID=94132 RepID=UPI0022F37D61|nr:flagellar biosynthetic protein FliR [Ramlibacter tataouinensis]WBY00606.1 flagellar biosynthetic protein FliR [Ramlibacter tataouinensis]
MGSPIAVTSAQLAGWMAAFLWPFLRMLALVSMAPVFGERAVPRRHKVATAALLTLAVAPVLGPMPQVPPVSGDGAWLAAQQVLVGLAMGFSMRLVFAMVQAAGEYAGLQMGLSFASFFDPGSGGQTMVLGRLLNALAMLAFLAFDGHLMVVAVLVHSFEALPVSTEPLAARGWMVLAAAGTQVIAGGLMLALPMVAALLILNLTMGVLTRVSPQISIFSVGFPMTLLAGLVLLQLVVQQLPAFLEPRFAAAFDATLRVLQALRP